MALSDEIKSDKRKFEIEYDINKGMTGNVSKIAKETNQYKLYQGEYILFSQIVHSTSKGLSLYYREDTKQMTYMQNDNNVRNAIVYSLNMMFKMSLLIQNRVGIIRTKDMEKIVNIYNEITKRNNDEIKQRQNKTDIY